MVKSNAEECDEGNLVNWLLVSWPEGSQMARVSILASLLVAS
jgi:hypothetical protein